MVDPRQSTMATKIARRAAAAPPVSTARATTTNNTFHSGYWSADVTALERALGELIVKRPVTNDCQVSFFEVPGDADLHVNVTHRHETVALKGWSGPASTPDGFVHNRRFQDRQSILSHIRDMVFAARI
jgi:hypothetical protein